MMDNMSRNEICVPGDALALPDDTETMVAPEVGDSVSVTVEGKVARVEGGNAYVTISAVNGKPIEAGEPEALPDTEEGMDEHFARMTAAQEGGV